MSKIKVLSAEELAVLDNSYPVSEESNKLSLPRLGMLSKDIVEEKGTGKNKTIKVIESAGTFYTEKDNGAIDPVTKKKVWTKEFIGEEISVIIAFERKQLRKFDASLNKFISSSVYDSSEQIIPLYLDKQIIKRGTPAQLQSLYPALTQKGKPTSDLKEETILFVLYNGELYQSTLSQSRKWSFTDYKKDINPSKVVTTLSSVEDQFGTNTYRKMTFTQDRFITQEEFDLVNESQNTLKQKVMSDAEYFLKNVEAVQLPSGKSLSEEMDDMVNESNKLSNKLN